MWRCARSVGFLVGVHTVTETVTQQQSWWVWSTMMSRKPCGGGSTVRLPSLLRTPRHSHVSLSRAVGTPAGIYSSGSIEAQKLLFGHTTYVRASPHPLHRAHCHYVCISWCRFSSSALTSRRRRGRCSPICTTTSTPRPASRWRRSRTAQCACPEHSSRLMSLTHALMQCGGAEGQAERHSVCERCVRRSGRCARGRLRTLTLTLSVSEPTHRARAGHAHCGAAGQQGAAGRGLAVPERDFVHAAV